MSKHHANTGNGKPAKSFGPVRIALILTQLLTLAAFIIILAGLSKLQKTANALGLTDTAANAATITAYDDVFQSAGVVPYPLHASDQFGFQWYLLFFELCLFVWIGIMALFPRTIFRMKHIAMAFLAYVFVLVTLQVNSVLFIKRNATANTVFGSRAIKTVLAGLLLLACCNGLSIMALGLIGTDYDQDRDLETAAYGSGGAGRNVKVVNTTDDLETGRSDHHNVVNNSSTTNAPVLHTDRM